jgi:hypothetical protein
MTNAMQSFLDSLDASDKRTIAKLVHEEGGTTWLRRLLHAVYVETLAEQVREDEILSTLEAQHRDEIDRLTEGWVKVWPPDEPPSPEPQ